MTGQKKYDVESTRIQEVGIYEEELSLQHSRRKKRSRFIPHRESGIERNFSELVASLFNR